MSTNAEMGLGAAWATETECPSFSLKVETWRQTPLLRGHSAKGSSFQVAEGDVEARPERNPGGAPLRGWRPSSGVRENRTILVSRIFEFADCERPRG